MVVRWYGGSVARWFGGLMARWFGGTWFDDTRFDGMWFGDTLFDDTWFDDTRFGDTWFGDTRFGGTVGRWNRGSVARSVGGTAVRWHVGRWYRGSVARSVGGTAVRWNGWSEVELRVGAERRNKGVVWGFGGDMEPKERERAEGPKILYDLYLDPYLSIAYQRKRNIFSHTVEFIKSMARFLSRTLIQSTSSSSSSNFLQTFKLGVSQPNRFSSRSGKAQLIEVELESEGEVVGLKKLEDVIHNIIVRQSTPDWLPFIPGSSYWVPPRRHRPESHGIVEVLAKFTNPLTEDESMSLNSSRGWPSSAYFLEGTSPVHPVEAKVDDNQENTSQPEDEEG
ncbi:hypothetical protein L6452_03308 [Arctium lappa]|uniref:Uncharacterized protein n=1 Tax=Arctium lappa TaxID=4217 RepID=A0ACB9FLA0_ARCLA|nr:hypothetical protein L6452_03308 [Arctium lappa]